MNHNDMLGIASQVTFDQHPTIGTRVVHSGENDYWLQLFDPTLPEGFQTGRKWKLSPYMCKSEVVQTVWSAYKAWLEHEARESFRFNGRPVFGPHFDVDKMWELAEHDDNYEVRI